MKKPPPSLRPFATIAAGLLALVACQNATDSNTNSDSPLVVTAKFPIAAPRVPDTAIALFQNDTVTNKLNCPAVAGSDSSTNCTATIDLPHTLGTDSVALQLWTLGVQTYTLYFKESGSSTKLDLGSHSVVSLDTLLLSGFANLPAAQKSAFGTGPSGLVAYYASLLLDKDTAVVGKALPVGMNIDSVKKELVRAGVDSGKTVAQLTSLSIQLGSITLTLDTTTIRLDVSILIRAGVISSADSTALYAAYPVQVQTPIAVSGPVVAGGSPVTVSGAFTWKAGKLVSPVFEVHTAKGVDTNFIFGTSNLPSKAATSWSLANNLTIQARSSVSVGTDTLEVTLSTDSGYFATSRATFQVVGRDTTAPALKILSPSSDTSVPNGTGSILVKAAATDSGSGLDSIAIGSTKFASSPCTTTVSLAVGVDTIEVQAWDNAGNKSTATVHVTRAKAPGDSVPPALKITSPSKDTAVPYTTTSLAITATATDSGSGMDYVMIGSTKLTSTPYTATVNLGVGTDTIVVQALDNVGNKSTATVHVTRSKDTTAPVIAPGAGTATRTVLFDTTKVQLSWTIQDNHGLDSLWLNGVPLTASKTPSQTANLTVGPNTFVLVVADSFGNTSRDSFVITRSPDVTGPAIAWITPSASISVDATVTSYKVQVKATDLSGVDSVYLQGVKANNDSGSYWSGTVSLPSPNGVPLKVVAKAWDKLKNLSVDSASITITRNAPSGTDKPALTLLQPSSNVGNSLPFANDTLHVVYKITDLVPLDTTTFLFGTTVPKRLTDSTWAADIPVPPTGQPTIIVIQVANANKVGSSDQIVVTRAKDTVPPTIVPSTGTVTRSVGYDTASIVLSWAVSDNYKMGSITLNGASLAVKSTVVDTASLSVGANPFVLVATDTFGNTSEDSISVTRNPGTIPDLTVNRAAGTYDSTLHVTISTSVAGAVIRYTLDGSDPTTSTTALTYSTTVLIDQSRTLKAVAAAANYTPSTIASRIYTLVVPVPVPTLPAGTSSDSTLMVDFTDSISGTTIYYTLDGSTPTANSMQYIVGATGAIRIDSLRTLKAIAVKPGWTTSAVLTAPYKANVAVKVFYNFYWNATSVIRADGSLWSTGSAGGLMDGSLGDRTEFAKVMDSVKDVTIGHILKMNGDLYAYGADDAGQFGNGTTNPTSTNTPVFIRHNVAKVSDGHEFSLILDNSGNLYAAGDNSQGEFCNATFSNSSTYTLVKSNVTDMSAGYRDEQYGSAQWTVFVTTAGNAYTCGSGPLGNGSSNQYQIDTAKLVGTGYSDVYAMDGSNWGGEGTFLLSSNGDAYSTGGMTGSLIAASSPTLSDTAFAFVRGNVKLISGQGGLVYLLDASGSAVGSCGINGVGALGDGTTACSGTPKTVSTNVKFVAAAENNSFFIKSDGTLWATGQNEGVFGNGSVAPTTTPVRVTLP